MRCEDFRRASVAGVELRYLRQGPGRPVVLLHTLRTQLDYFSRLLDRLDTEMLDVRGAILVGESIGGTIALMLAARGDGRVARVLAVNPYDYGVRGGIRRSS